VAERTREFFLTLCAALGACAIAQFLLQLIMPPQLLFPIENFAPKEFVVQLFNQQAPLAYGATLYRSNGVFMIEPSMLSQLLAVALLIELSSRTDVRRSALYCLGIVFTYSGTGLAILAVCLPVFIITSRQWKILVGIAASLVVLALLREPLHLDILLSRSTELSATGSSGFARFVGGFWLFDQFLLDDVGRAFLGFGAGAFTDYVPLARLPASEMPLFKMIFEFGAFGAIIYFAFLCYCVFSTDAPLPVRLALFMSLMVNGLSNPFAHGLAFGLLVWTTPWRGRVKPARVASEAAR
ncbi:MAG: hypothetical protein ABW110_05255, partial [Steroidobacteraceae bacterium]